MGLEKLTQWSGPTTPLRAAPGQYESADRHAEGVDVELHHESAIHAGDEPVSEAASSCNQLLAGGQNADHDMRRPGERLHVYRSAGGWTSQDGDQRLTVHGFRSEAALSRGEIVLTTSSLAKEAAALSCMRCDPRDIRPLLLLMFYAQDEAQAKPILRYGINYLTTWVGRMGEMSKTDAQRKVQAIRWAAADGLAELYRARGPRPSHGGTARLVAPSADARAKLVGVREASFAMLRRKAICMYEMRLNEAKADYTKGAATQRDLANRVSCAIDGCPNGDSTGHSDGDGMDRQKLSSWWSVREALLAKRAPVHMVLGNVAVSTPAKR